MVQRCHSTRFLLKTPQPISVKGERHGKNFDSDIASQARVTRAIHFSHSARAYGRLNFIGAEFGTGHEGHQCALL